MEGEYVDDGRSAVSELTFRMTVLQAMKELRERDEWAFVS